jgi:hypothetical protein
MFIALFKHLVKYGYIHFSEFFNISQRTTMSEKTILFSQKAMADVNIQNLKVCFQNSKMSGQILKYPLFHGV